MHKNSIVINAINEKTFPLTKFHYSGRACNKKNAIELINLINLEEIPILGGDVYELNINSIKPCPENWSCEMQPDETWEDFCKRSKYESQEYISKYPTTETTLFSLVFPQEVNYALEISENDISQSALILDKNWLMCPNCIDAWESTSLNAVVICPKCSMTFHNPRH